MSATGPSHYLRNDPFILPVRETLGAHSDNLLAWGVTGRQDERERQWQERERDLVTVAARQAAPALNPAGKHCGRDTEPRSGTGNSRQTASCKVSTSDGRTRPHAGHPYASKPPQKPPLAHLPITRTTRISNQQRWHQERKNERTNSSQGRLARAAWRTRADPRLRTKRGGPPPRHPSPCGANPRPQSPAARPRT